MTTMEMYEDHVRQTVKNLTKRAADLILFADELQPTQESVATEQVLPTNVMSGFRSELGMTQEKAQTCLRKLARAMEAFAWELAEHAHDMGYIIETEIVEDLDAVRSALDEIDGAAAPTAPVFVGGSGDGRMRAV